MSYVTFVSKNIAKAWTPDDNTILISINHPGDDDLYFSGWEKVLWLFFDDVTEHVGGYEPFTLEMAQHIKDFVSKDKDVVVHCTAGVSRSAAVAKWISEEFGHTVVFSCDGIQTLEYHNSMVYNILNASVGKDMASYYKSLEQNAFLNGEEI